MRCDRSIAPIPATVRRATTPRPAAPVRSKTSTTISFRSSILAFPPAISKISICRVPGAVDRYLHLTGDVQELNAHPHARQRIDHPALTLDVWPFRGDCKGKFDR